MRVFRGIRVIGFSKSSANYVEKGELCINTEEALYTISLIAPVLEFYGVRTFNNEKNFGFMANTSGC